MERISDKELKMITNEFLKSCVSTGSGIYDDKIICYLQELKERRAADSKKLDIKAQLRLVRYKCPDMWKLILAENCPYSWGLERTVKILCEQCYPNCKECWDKALEGDE